jgi:hypothetical protein
MSSVDHAVASGEAIQQILDAAMHTDGYIELQQLGAKGKPVAVSGHGGRDYKVGEPGAIQAVQGSRWQTAFWPVHHGAVYLGKISLVVLVMFLLAAGGMAGVTLVLFRRLTAALRQDQISLVTLMKDFRDEQVRREYPHGLDEMQETLEFMTGLAGGYALKGSAAGHVERAQDAAYAAEKEKVETIVPDYVVPQADTMIVEDDPLEFTTAAEEENAALDASIFRAYDIRGVLTDPDGG